ncbi:MAG: ATP-binding protein [Nanoarchaeota archaeon]|nr:ATP-binding protein [Nanoarchaeota archaeon]
MKFVNRENELKQMEEYSSLSKKQLITIAVSGLRRIGKTTLAKEFIKNKKAIYFFVYESKNLIRTAKRIQ